MRLLRTLPLFVVCAAPLAAANHNVNVGPGNSFSPATVNIAVGDTVTWHRMGGTHNVRADDGSFTNGAASSSWTHFEHQFNGAGSFEYFCEAHSTANGNTMNGVVNVGGGGSAGSVQFSAATAQRNENQGTVTLTVTRTGGDDGAVSVQYFTANGSAVFPGDYIQTNGTLNWADNDDDNKTFTVPIVNDGTAEGSENFTVRLESPTGGATIGGQSTITVTINDDDGGGGSAGTIRFTQAAASRSESSGAGSLVVERINGTAGAVSVQYSFANGSASSPADYSAAGGTLNWAAGDGATKSVPFTIVDDSVNEGNESFTSTLTAPTGGASLGNITQATITIEDDDTNCVPSTCVSDAANLCLAGGSGTPGRFRVAVQWTDFQGNTGAGVAVPNTGDSGFFYFFEPSNLELLAKIVNGCGLTDAYWFFNAAASNVGLVYTVTDLQRCVTRTVTNPLGNFASNGDTEFFPTSCP